MFVFETLGCKSLESRQKTRLFALVNYLACVIKFPSRLVSFSLRLTDMIYESSSTSSSRLNPLFASIAFSRSKWLFRVQVRSLRTCRRSPALPIAPSPGEPGHFGEDQERKTPSDYGTQAPIAQRTALHDAKRRLRSDLKRNNIHVYEATSCHDMFRDCQKTTGNMTTLNHL